MTRDFIYLVTIPLGTPSNMLIDGKLFIDLPEDFSFQLTERLEEISDVNKLQGSGVLDIDLDYTERNLFIFEPYINPNTKDRSFDPLEVRAFGGGNLPIRQDLLYFKGANDGSRTISISLVDSDDFWLPQAQELQLSSLDLGTFVVDLPDMLANWQNAEWINGGDDFWFPLVHYGAFHKQQDQFAGVSLEDLLPWVSVPGLLKAGFQAIGWKFDSPLLDTSWFKRLWTLLIEKDIQYTGKGAAFYVDVETDENIFFLSTPGFPNPNMFLWFDTENSDVSGSHEVIAGPGMKRSLYINLSQIQSDFDIRLFGTVNNASALPQKFDLVAWLHDENIDLAGVYNISFDGSETKDIDVTIKVNLDYGQQIAVRAQALVGSGTSGFTFLPGFRMQVTPSSNRLYRGDTVPIGELISDDYLFIDFLKGVIHLGAFRLKTEANTRTVWLYPLEESDVYDEIVEGFLLDTDEAIDITPDVEVNSRKVIIPQAEEARYFQLKFNGDGDEYIKKRLKIEKENPLWGRSIDMGRGDEKKTTKLENPFFEPMGDITWNSLHIPAVWDNEDGERMRETGPRIGLAVGYTSQAFTDDPIGAASVSWTFEYQVRTSFPWISMRPTRAKFVVGTGYEETVESVVYGGAKPNEKDLYTMFWDQEFTSRKFSKIYEFIIFAGQELFTAMDFRHRLVLIYSGEKAIYRLIEKSDYRTSQQIPMLIKARPEPSILKKRR